MDSRLNIVVVEDSDALRAVTVEALSVQGHRVVGVSCAEELEEKLGSSPVDLMVIDLILPGEDGISLARRMRKIQPGIGILMVTGCSPIDRKIAGYESGADFYLVKPVAVEELCAAVRALARRLRQPVSGEFPFRLNLRERSLSGANGATGLTVSEAALLAALIRAPGQRLEYWQLIEQLGKEAAIYSKSSLEVHVVRLRKKLVQVGAESSAIKAVYEWGYQLCVGVGLA